MVKFFWNITWLIWHPFLRMFCNFRVYNQQVLTDLREPVIVAIAMHGHRLDPWIAGAAFPFNTRFFPIYYVTAEKYIKMPLLGLLLRAYGAFPIKIGIGVEESLQPAVKHLQSGHTIGIFPEGSLSKENILRPGKKGTAYLSKTAGVKILPLALSATRDLSFKNLILRKTNITAIFGQPYLVEENDLQLATHVLMQKIQSLYA